MRKYLTAVAAALLLVSSGAGAHGNGFWILAAIPFCLIQDDAYAQLPGGRMWAREESIVRFIKDLAPEVKACIESKKDADARVCKALLTINPNADESEKALEAIRATHAQAVEDLVTGSCERT